MGVKVVVRDGETIEQAMRRFRLEVAKLRALNRWPRYGGYFAKPSALRHRREWLQARVLRNWLKQRQRHTDHEGAI